MIETGRFWRTIGYWFVVAAIAWLAPEARANSDYWQQHVSYTIAATLIDSIHTLDGHLSVVYTNNSPDTLNDVFFHLYANAFQPGSLMDERARANNMGGVYDRISKLPRSEWGMYEIAGVTVNGIASQNKTTGTILNVHLPVPLLPQQSITIAMPFREQIPRQIRRSGWRNREGIEYSMSQWYPKLCEYDREGWHTQEYVEHEFYGVWGNFDVKITLPSSFTLGATGECQNPQEVGHGYDQIAHGVREGMFGPDPQSIDSLRARMTRWHFTAHTVHDFAWTADERYIHQWSTWRDSITVHGLYANYVAGAWQNALKYTTNVLAIYSELYGNYPYRDFSTTMAGDGGMEYPQLIMITGYRGELSLAGVIAHEVGHQWFYGMLGSNETRQAFMDEGFTSYVTTVAMNRMFGRHQLVPGQAHSWLDWFLPLFDNKSDNYGGYQNLAKAHYEEPLTIPHDWFRDDANGGQVYGKTQAILSMLEYTLGDSVFALGMHRYFDLWHFKHPHLIDFQKVMESVSNTDLSWFFDEWFSTTRTLDYAAEGVSSTKSAGWYETKIHLHNRDVAVMPIDLLLHYSDGTSQDATIPLAVNKNGGYQKPGDPNRIFFPDWDWVEPRYRASALTPKEVSWIEIDTSWRLQDLDWKNNYSTWLGIHRTRGYWALWKQLFVWPPHDGYYAVVRPILWYDMPSGLNLGLGIKYGEKLDGNGDFKIFYKAKYYDDGQRQVPVSSHFYDRLDGQLKGTFPVDWLGRLTNAGYLFNKIDGVSDVKLSVTHIIRPGSIYLGPTHTVAAYIEAQDWLNQSYPYYHHFWQSPKTRIVAGEYTYRSFDYNTRFESHLESSIWNSDSTFSCIRIRFGKNVDLGKEYGLNFKFVAGTSVGNVPIERKFFLGMASPYEEQANDFYRAVTDLETFGGAAMINGGAGVRAFIRQLATGRDNWAGSHMLGSSLDLAIPNPLASLGSFARSFGLGLFADAGWVTSNTFNMWADLTHHLATDAGATISVEVLNWLPQQIRGVADEYASIPTVSIYFPIYVNHPIDGGNPVAFRSQISFGSTF